MNDEVVMPELSTKEIFDRMYHDSSCIEDLSYLYNADPSGKSAVQMDAEKQRVLIDLGMLEQDEAYRRFLNNLWQIEDFVAQVLSCDKPGFSMVENRFGVRIPRSVAPLGKYFTWVYGYAIQLEFGYEYSLRVELFMNCWKTLRLWEVLFDDPNGFTPVEGKKKYELFNDFIDLIRTESRTVQYRKRVSRANEKVAKRWRRSKLLVDALFEYRSSRLLVLRLDFGYRREIAKDITAAVAKADLDHFLNNRRGNPKLFRGWLSYIRKMEFAPQKGIHFHLIIFFNGVLRHKDAYLAQKIGEYWEKVTEMRGRYWNCNDSKHEYKRRGIGLIEHDDETKRNILLDDVVMYLAKTEQHVRSSILGSSVGNESDDHDETHKLFVLGAIPHKRRSVSGRPRRQPAAESFMG